MKKRLITLALITTMSMVSVLQASAQEIYNEEEALSLESIVVEEIDGEKCYSKEVDPYDIDEIDNVIKLYGLMPEVADDLYAYHEKCLANEIDDLKLTITTDYNPISRTEATQKGYKDKQYMKQSVRFDSISEYAVILNKISSADFWDAILKNIVVLSVDGTINTITKGSWTTVNLFDGIVPGDVPAGTEHTLEASLDEAGRKIFTYIKVDGEYVFGSRVSEANYSFKHRVKIPDIHFDETVDPVETFYVKTPSFDDPEKAAYYGYVNGGVTESISSYKWGGRKFLSDDM